MNIRYIAYTILLSITFSLSSTSMPFFKEFGSLLYEHFAYAKARIETLLNYVRSGFSYKTSTPKDMDEINNSGSIEDNEDTLPASNFTHQKIPLQEPQNPNNDQVYAVELFSIATENLKLEVMLNSKDEYGTTYNINARSENNHEQIATIVFHIFNTSRTALARISHIIQQPDFNNHTLQLSNAILEIAFNKFDVRSCSMSDYLVECFRSEILDFLRYDPSSSRSATITKEQWQQIKEYEPHQKSLSRVKTIFKHLVSAEMLTPYYASMPSQTASMMQDPSTQEVRELRKRKNAKWLHFENTLLPQILKKENEYKSSYFFYHTTQPARYLFSYFYTKLYEAIHNKQLNDFIFLRQPEVGVNPSAQQRKIFKRRGTDNDGRDSFYLLSVNPSPFCGCDDSYNSSLLFFIHDKGSPWGKEDSTTALFSHPVWQYLDENQWSFVTQEFTSIAKEMPSNIMLQIALSRDSINKCAYFAYDYGIKIRSLIDSEQINDARSILDTLRVSPTKIKQQHNLTETLAQACQFRIILTADLLLHPEKGQQHMKLFRHSFNEQALKEAEHHIDTLVTQFVSLLSSDQQLRFKNNYMHF